MRTTSRALAVVIGVIAFAIYLKTLVPGVGGSGDSAKFQYLGSVLGTAHPPGYPLYVFVSYAFSHLPLGSLAFRINLMSAFFGAVTITLVCTTLQRLGSSSYVAAAAALGLAFGRTFWGKSTVAEVYTLNAALVALVVWQAVRWSERGRRKDLYLTAALLGISLGNHLTAAMLAPALALFVLVRRPEEVRAKTAAICVGLGALGLVQYGFILVRTWQRSPYVEAQASSLPELWRVLTASKYSSDMFHFTWREILTSRLSEIARLFAQELRPEGLVLLALGIVAMSRVRSRPAVLFAATLIGVVALTLNVDADGDGFLLPAFVMAWLLVGLGVTTVLSRVTNEGTAARSLAGVVMLCVPAIQFGTNYAASDHHRRTYEARYLSALFTQLEPRAVFLKEEYAVDQLLLYKLAGEKAGGGASALVDGRLQNVQRYARDGHPIYAFTTQRTRLEGLGFRFDPVQLREAGAHPEPIDMTYLPLFRLRAWAPCAEIGNQGWRDISAAASRDPLTLNIDNYRSFEARVVLYAAGDESRPPMPLTTVGPESARMQVATFRTTSASDMAQLGEAFVRDGVPNTLRPDTSAAAFVHRAEFTVNDGGQAAQVVVGLSGNRKRVIVRATVDRNDPHRATACSWVDRSLLAVGARDVLTFTGTDDRFFGRGWAPATPIDSGGSGRWLADRSADLVVPLEKVSTLRLTFRAAPSDDDHGHALSLVVNGTPLGARPMTNVWADYAWSIPEALLREGGNRVTVDAGGTQTAPEPSAVVGAIALDRDTTAQR